MNRASTGLAKLEIGEPGFDSITFGGLPRARSTLVAGTSGTGKTVFAVQFLTGGIVEYGEHGVLVTCDESADDLRRNAAGLGFDLAAWEKQRSLKIVDLSPEPGQVAEEHGRFDLEGLLARLEHATTLVGAHRVSIDSLASLSTRFNDQKTLRGEMHRVFSYLKSKGITLVVTAERGVEDGPVARHGVEEFVADNVIVLRNRREHRTRRRTAEVLKFRGTDHLKGEWPFVIFPGKGIQVVPHNARSSGHTASKEKVTIGHPGLDAMLGGGVFRGSMVLASGAPGTGKTLLVAHFASGQPDPAERCLLVAFEEGYDQLVRNAAGWGIDFTALEAAGRLRIHCDHPDVSGTEEQLIRIQKLVDEFQPTRVVVDGLTAIESSAGEQGNYDFVMGVTALVRQRNLACLLTSSTISLLGGQSITECRASTLADAIVLLRYAEVSGAIARSIAVLKVRGSTHDRDLREVTIDANGMHIGRVFSNVTGILSGQISVITDDELARTHGALGQMPDRARDDQ